MKRQILNVLIFITYITVGGYVHAQEDKDKGGPETDKPKNPHVRGDSSERVERPDGQAGWARGGKGARGAMWGGFGGGAGMGVAGMREAILQRILNNPKLAEQAGLSAEQIETLKGKIQEIDKDRVELEAELEKNGLEQARLLSTEPVDEEALMKVVEKAGEVRTKLAKIQMKRFLVAGKIITPAQIEKIRELVRERVQEQRKGWKEERPGGEMKRGPTETGAGENGGGKASRKGGAPRVDKGTDNAKNGDTSGGKK